jgi:hypothetical protein
VSGALLRMRGVSSKATLRDDLTRSGELRPVFLLMTLMCWLDPYNILVNRRRFEVMPGFTRRTRGAAWRPNTHAGHSYKRPPRRRPRVEAVVDVDAGTQQPEGGVPALKNLLERKLAWYGLRPVTLGPFRRLRDEWLLCDLISDDGRVLCRLMIDRRSGTVRVAADGEPKELMNVAGRMPFAPAVVEPPSEWHPTAAPHPTD